MAWEVVPVSHLIVVRTFSSLLPLFVLLLVIVIVIECTLSELGASA